MIRSIAIVTSFLLCSHAVAVEKILVMIEGDLWDIGMINPDGSGYEELRGGPGHQHLGAVHPSGDYFVFWEHPPGSPALMKRYDFRTGAESVILSTTIVRSHGSFTPDGTAILPYSWPGGCVEDIYQITTAGTITRLRAEGGRQLVWGMGPAGRIYYTSDPCSSPHTQLRRWDPATNAVQILLAPDGRDEQFGAISPDGSMLVYRKSDSGFSPPRRIYGLLADGSGNEFQVSRTVPGTSDSEPTFSPDSQRVAYLRTRRPGTDQVVITDWLGSSESIVFDPGAQMARLDWAEVNLCTFGISDLAIRGTGKPIEEVHTWDSCGGSGSLQLRVGKGLTGSIHLNDDEVVPERLFHEGSLSVPVELPEGTNTLRVELRGKPGSTAEISILPQ